MDEELPPNLRPSEAAPEDRQLVEEIVSSVQPPKSKFSRHAIQMGLIAVVVIFGIGYLVIAGRSALQLKVKEAKAPEDIIAGLQMPTHTETASLPAVVTNPYQPALVQPPAVIDETPPTPRISSTFTNEPSVATKPTPPAQVAGANTQIKPPYTYTSAHGFSFRVPAGGTVQEVEQGRLVVRSAKGQVLSEVTILPNSNALINGVPAELALSTNISDIRQGVLGSDSAFYYRVNTKARGMYVLHGSTAYYITDYSGVMLQTFKIYP